LAEEFAPARTEFGVVGESAAEESIGFTAGRDSEDIKQWEEAFLRHDTQLKEERTGADMAPPVGDLRAPTGS